MTILNSSDVYSVSLMFVGRLGLFGIFQALCGVAHHVM